MGYVKKNGKKWAVIVNGIRIGVLYSTEALAQEQLRKLLEKPQYCSIIVR